MSGADPFDLERFVTAQAPVFPTVLSELKAGRKRTHWMWFVFPQARGLGHSSMATFYGIASLNEARAYLAHPPPAQFRLIVSPLVMWIWIGGLIGFGGGLIALWPPPSAIRRHARAAVRARVADGLARA